MLFERGRTDSALRGMGTTLTAARSLGRDLLITHVGDSRAYLLRNRRAPSSDARPYLCSCWSIPASFNRPISTSRATVTS